MRLAIALLLISLASLVPRVAKLSPLPPEDSGTAIYDQNPSHIWNRLYAALLVRESAEGKRYGEDSLDPMLWRESNHLLAEPSHQIAVHVLNEFLQTRAENLIHDPLKRAMLLRDLWSVFDWSVEQYSEGKGGQPGYGNAKRELQARLAEVLERLAPSLEQIRSLPNNYAQAVASGVFAPEYDPAYPRKAFLPPDLFDPRGPWVCITPSPESIGHGGVAKFHVANVSGRSVFLVFMRLPHQATFGYFEILWNFPQPWVAGPSPDGPLEVNPDLPSFPSGTQVALVRQMMLFDSRGNLVVSPIIESIQIRVYREITTALPHAGAGMNRNSGQDFFEVRLSRPLLFSGKQGGLRPMTPDEAEPPTIGTFGFDLIDANSQGPEKPGSSPQPIMKRCSACHSGGGVRSLESVDSLLKPARRQQEPRDVNYGPRYWSENSAIWWKENRYDWGLLNGYWNARQ